MDLSRGMFLATMGWPQGWKLPGLPWGWTWYQVATSVLAILVVVIAWQLWKMARMKSKTEKAAARILSMSEEVLSLSSLPISRNEVGNYRLQNKIYEGVGSTTYRALDKEGRVCDVKIPTSGALQDKMTIARLEREAQVLEIIDNPHVVKFRAFERVKDRGRLIPLMVTESLDGMDLADVIKREAPLPVDEVLDILDDVAAALAAVHRNEVVHRNVKPASIRIMKDGRAILYNFGVAQVEDMQALTQRGDVLGTGLYMSPEQITGKPVDGRSDLYSLGIVAYEMLTGHPPHAGAAFGELVIRKMTQEAPRPALERPEVPDEVDELVYRLLQKEPEKRPHSAGYLITELHQIRKQLSRSTEED